MSHNQYVINIFIIKEYERNDLDGLEIEFP